MREELKRAVMEGGRADAIIHDFDTVRFPAHGVQDVGDDALQLVQHAASLDAGAEVAGGEVDEVVVAELVVVGNGDL